MHTNNDIALEYVPDPELFWFWLWNCAITFCGINSGSNMEGNTNTTSHFHMHADGAVNSVGLLFVSLINMCSSSTSTHRPGLSICKPGYCLQSKTNILFHEFCRACLRACECVACLWNRESLQSKVLNMDTSHRGKPRVNIIPHLLIFDHNNWPVKTHSHVTPFRSYCIWELFACSTKSMN